MQILTKATQQAAPTAAADLTNKQYVDDRIVNHGHSIAQITNLQAALNALSPNGHTHTIDQIASLWAYLNAKANLDSPVFTGVPQSPYVSYAADYRIANCEYVERRAAANGQSQAANYYTALRNELLPLIGSGGSAPRPNTSGGVGWWGQLSQICITEDHQIPNTGVGRYVKLPYGGTWAYIVLNHSGGISVTTSPGVGVVAGGHSFGYGYPGNNTLLTVNGLGWRIA